MLLTAASVAEDLQKSGLDLHMPDLVIESERRQSRKRSSFRLVDGKVELVSVTDPTEEDTSSVDQESTDEK
jgi:hypothetical protein